MLRAGKVYKNNFAADGFLHKTTAEQKQNEIRISLQMNTDGVSLFQSSKMQIWPVYYTINELHPRFRYQRKYRIFAGLWFDVKKPDFKTFLNPFMKELNTFGVEGEILKTLKGQKKVRVFLLSGIFDAPAKSQFQNITQFNGEYGCSYCLEPGKTVKAGKGHTHCFPFNHNNVNGHAKTRTHESMIEHATKAQNQMMESGQESKVCGVKGLCWPMMLPRFDIVNGLGLDYMHNTLLGVIKMLMKLWFFKNYKKCAWYVGNQLKSLKLPNLISRVPRSIEKDFGQWKASEFRSFCLIYSIPLAKNFLPEEYYDHYVLLVQAVAILLKEVISEKDLEESRYLLKKFCLQIERLYGGERYYTYNVHNLLHMTTAVENLGPLWCQSAFSYEDYNGDFKYLFHGTQSVSMQIVTNTIIQHKIPEIARSLLPGCTGYTLYSKMTLNYHQLAKNSGDKISHNVFTVGKFSSTPLPSKDRVLVDHRLNSFQEIKVFKRICLNGNIIQSKEYTRVTKRNSYTVNYNGRYGNSYGFVKYFLRAKNGDAFGYYAVLELLNVYSRMKNTTHILTVSKDITLDVCRIDDIIDLCIYISCKSGNYIALFPNKIEND
ncbi:uncharacterized protein [Clytia hemisphaerica]|uniref:uncharacterized protein n=1 Tax=Clytia hemisphaerica TaxID=252671 RepID=UPI0034D3DF33